MPPLFSHFFIALLLPISFYRIRVLLLQPRLLTFYPVARHISHVAVLSSRRVSCSDVVNVSVWNRVALVAVEASFDVSCCRCLHLEERLWQVRVKR